MNQDQILVIWWGKRIWSCGNMSANLKRIQLILVKSKILNVFFDVITTELCSADDIIYAFREA